MLELTALLRYPFYDEDLGQLFPFRTLCMIIALLIHILMSLLARWLFIGGRLPATWDFLHCFDGSRTSSSSIVIAEADIIGPVSEQDGNAEECR